MVQFVLSNSFVSFAGFTFRQNVHAREIAMGRINIPIGLEAVGDGCSERLRELVNSVIDDVREDRQARENENVVFNGGVS
ncbi:unnamed protein product [Caenorhabditis auriculariae]|uniref:Uncharacterized protein n=1 Tax=Caenorhabditis auriculariae TaxID=2777116 RepID=A0A8S1GLX7_9PELO|nr:unnamed protein product [Caenorhabditis auriculariae]